MQFYILMLDFGRRGLEAVVRPEMTRADVVAEYRGATHPVFVKFVDGDSIEDVTEDIRAEARDAAHVDFEVGVQTVAWDHARDLRKHEAA
jgi:hypothetical protein